MKINKNILFGLAVVVMLFSSCKKENMCDCIKRTGAMTSEIREIPSFDKIIVKKNVNVYITQDSIQSVKVEAGKNLIALIRTDVSGDGTLTITNDNKCNWMRSYQKKVNVYLSVPHIRYVTSNGSGTIKGENMITGDSLDVRTMSSGDIDLQIDVYNLGTHLFGTGDLTLSGTAHDNGINTVGNGVINCQDLKTNYTWLLSNTTGDAYINVTDLFIVTLNNSGNIYYYGHPSTIQKVVSGTGHLYAE